MSLLIATFCVFDSFSEIQFFVFQNKFDFDFTTFSLVFFCFRINCSLTTCCWLSGRSENTKILLNARGCVFRLYV